VLQRVHLASDKLQQWMHNDEPFGEDTECWHPYTCTWCLEPSTLVVSLLVAVSTPSGTVGDNDLIKLKRWAEKVKVNSGRGSAGTKAKESPSTSELICFV
jgi:hypothetical protein